LPVDPGGARAAAVNENLRGELLALIERDRSTRQRLLEAGVLYGDYAAEMQQVHVDNAERLNELIARHGWPDAGLVGASGAEAAWRIAQHAVCTPALQRRFLAVLSQAVVDGQAPAWQLAMLSDRIRFHEGRPQRYGCVLDWNDQGELDCEVESAERLDEHRAAVGLPPFAEHLRQQREAMAAEGGGPPDDLAGYRRRQLEWAREMGWR
jgi:hypothetical protein